MVSLHLGTQHLEKHCRQAPETSQSSSTRKSQKVNMIRIIANNKQLLDETKSNIRFVLPGQVILGEAKCDSFFHSVWNEIREMACFGQCVSPILNAFGILTAFCQTNLIFWKTLVSDCVK